MANISTILILLGLAFALGHTQAAEAQVTSAAKEEAGGDSRDMSRFMFNFGEAENEDFWTECPEEEGPLNELDSQCRLLRLFNQTELDEMDLRDRLEGKIMESSKALAKLCACQLIRMRVLWRHSFARPLGDLTRMANLVLKTFSRQNGTYRPDHLWNDMDVLFRGVSIHTATSDFFRRLRSKELELTSQERDELYQDDIWQLTVRFCSKIDKDQHGLYRYFENLNRINAVVFVGLTLKNQLIDDVYAASKMCKLLLRVRPQFDWQLRPENPQLVPVLVADSTGISNIKSKQHHMETTTRQPPIVAEEDDSQNEVQLDQFDDMLKDASVMLLQCQQLFNMSAIPLIETIDELKQECPVMISDKVPFQWLLDHPNDAVRTDYAIRCGCQLLRHKAYWSRILLDDNVRLLTKALVNYLSYAWPPDLFKGPIFSIHGWFQQTMGELIKSRARVVEQVQMAYKDERDLSDPLKSMVKDEVLDKVRRGCTYIIFNHNKGKTNTLELKLIQYLDNLQKITQDPMFVFSLVLQDPNLFKLYALSKLCYPFIYEDQVNRPTMSNKKNNKRL